MGSQATLDAIRLFVALVSVAGVAALVVRRLAIPYSVTLVVLGLVASTFIPHGELAVTPELVLLVLVPGLVFEASLRLEVRLLRQTFAAIALLAVPGVVVTALIVAFVLQAATGLPFPLGLVVGAMVAATDPVAVLATFRHIGSPRRLTTLVESESLFNDGTALVVFAIALRAAQVEVTPGEALLGFAFTVAASSAIGLVAGWAASRLIAMTDDRPIELTISLAAAYGTYLLADAIHQSGIISTVIAGVVIGNYGRRLGMSERTREALDTVWDFIAFLLTAFAFMLVGLAIPLSELVVALPSILWGVVAIVVGRAIVVYGLLGGAAAAARRFGAAAIPVGWLHVMFWAGLRGAVAVAMALSLPADFPQRALLQEITFGIVLFTLFVQGTTAERVVRRAGAVEPLSLINISEPTRPRLIAFGVVGL
jgi:CPA1 family monovalent cation:H+ antiporter